MTIGITIPASVSAPSVDKSGQRVTSPGVRDKGEKRLCPPLCCLLYIAELHSIPYCVSATPKQLWRLGHPIICLIGAAGGEKTWIFMTFTPEIRECNTVIKHQDSGAL